MVEILVECLCKCLCQTICVLICENLCANTEDSTISNDRSRRNQDKHVHSEISKVNYVPLPVGPMDSIELPNRHIHQLPLNLNAPPHNNNFTEAELIISTNESAFSIANSTPQVLVSSIRADAIEHILPLQLAKQKFEEFTDSSAFNTELAERLFQSLVKGGQCNSNLLSLAVILTGNCPASVKAEMVFELYQDENNAEVIKGKGVSQMMAQIFTVSVRHLPQLVQSSEKGINEVRNYCKKLEEGVETGSQYYASALLAWQLELSKSQFLMKIQDQFCFLLSASEIRKEIINYNASSSH